MLVALVLFVVPARSANLGADTSIDDLDKEGEDENEGSNAANAHNRNDTTLLDWETANQMPYDVVFLLGGGFALAKAFIDSGLSSFLGEQLAKLEISTTCLVILMITLIIWLTELTSNTATSNVMIPIAASIAINSQVSPYTFMIPAAMACSCAFVLPIATPPNLVAFSTGQLPMREMNKAGVFLNIVCSFILWAAAYTVIPVVLGVSAMDFPSWAVTS